MAIFKECRHYVSDERMALRERSDCAVRATANATGLPYLYVHSTYAKAGRPNKRGTHVTTMDKAITEIAGATQWHKRAWDAPRLTVTTFAKRNPVGRFVVYTGNHALAVIDGVVIDARPHSRVEGFWQVPELFTAVPERTMTVVIPRFLDL